MSFHVSFYVNDFNLSLIVDHVFFSFHSPDVTPTSTPGEFLVTLFKDNFDLCEKFFYFTPLTHS